LYIYVYYLFYFIYLYIFIYNLKRINNLSLVKTLKTNFPYKTKLSNAHEKHEHSFPSESTRVLRRPIVFLRFRSNVCFRCSVLILLRKAERYSIRSL
jgi:hypothetical protein